MQGELAQAKNGDELFWEDKSHAANWKAQACTQGALFLLSFKVSGGKDFFSFFPGSQCVPTMSPSSSQFVPQQFIHSTSLLSHVLWQIFVLLSPI